MDNPSYFHPTSQPHSKAMPNDLLLDTLQVNDDAARQRLDEQLSILTSRVTAESPSFKLMKKCSLRRLLSTKGGEKKPPGVEFKRSQSLSHEEANSSSDYMVERSRSFSAAASWANPKMTHETAQHRNSIGSCTPREAVRGDMSQKPPLPPSIGNNDRYRAVLRPTVPEIGIIFSSSCSVSTEWANYITNLLKSQGYKHIVLNDIESSSSKRGAEDNVVLRKDAATSSAAKAIIVILSQSFLDWLYTHPMSSIGSLFKDSTKVIGLLLGITKDHVKAEHRAELLTFAVWKFLLTIKPNDYQALSQSLIKAVSSMMPNQPIAYVMPRPMRKFKVWPQTIQDKALLILNEKISVLDKIQVTLEVYGREALLYRVTLDNKDLQLINEVVIEVNLPQMDRDAKSVKFKLETSGLFWSPQSEIPLKLDRNPLLDLDAYLSTYLKQGFSGAIEVMEDPKLPTLLHFAVRHNMSQLVQTLLDLPGGRQMASMTNDDGLNAREMAVHAGNLPLANLLKDPKTPRQNYELPVLRSDSRLSTSLDLKKASPPSVGESFYDIPRKVEQCYVVPPAPRPVESKLKYVNMNKCPSEVLSRQDLLKPLLKSTSMDNLPEPAKTKNANEEEPKSPLDFLHPFTPLSFPKVEEGASSVFFDRLKAEFSQVQLPAGKGQMSLTDLQTKFAEWQIGPFYESARESHAAQVDELISQWQELINRQKSLESDLSFRKKFRKLIKNSKKKNDPKYSTLPSMPMRLKRARAASATTPDTNCETATNQSRSKSCSVSEFNPDSDTSSNSSFEKS